MNSSTAVQMPMTNKHGIKCSIIKYRPKINRKRRERGTYLFMTHTRERMVATPIQLIKIQALAVVAVASPIQA